MNPCLFCRILNKELPSKIQYEDDKTLVIHDIHPQAPVHLLFIPKVHIERISDLSENEVSLAGELIYRAKRIAEENSWADYRLLFNNGPESGQTVFHIHLHLLSGRRMHWPPG